MVREHCLFTLIFATACAALPATTTQAERHVHKINSIVDDLRLQCSNNDGIACIKYKFLNLLDEALKKDKIQVTENVTVEKNSEATTSVTTEEKENDDSSSRGFLDQVDEYVKNHDVVLQLPQMLGGARLNFSPRNIDNDEFDLKLKLQNEPSQVEGKGRKNRLRRLIIPLLVFVLLKAITLVPLALGVLGLKAWNALQLSFFSFLISISLAIFQLCKKIATDSALPVPAAHTGPWEAYSQYAAARNFFEQAAGDAEDTNEDPQFLAYNSHVPH